MSAYNGIEKNITVVLDVPIDANRLVPYEHEKIPRYYIIGGLVFEPLTLNYLHEFGGGTNWASHTPVTMLDHYFNGTKEKGLDEIVFLAKVLPDVTNMGFQDSRNVIIDEVNATKIKSFSQFVTLLNSNKKAFITIKSQNGLEITLDHTIMKSHNKNILSKFKILYQSLPSIIPSR